MTCQNVDLRYPFRPPYINSDSSSLRTQKLSLRTLTTPAVHVSFDTDLYMTTFVQSFTEVNLPTYDSHVDTKVLIHATNSLWSIGTRQRCQSTIHCLKTESTFDVRRTSTKTVNYTSSHQRSGPKHRECLG